MVTSFDSKKIILIGSNVGDYTDYVELTKILSLNMNSLKWIELDHVIEKNLNPLTFRTTTALNRRFCGKNSNLHCQLDFTLFL